MHSEAALFPSITRLDNASAEPLQFVCLLTMSIHDDGGLYVIIMRWSMVLLVQDIASSSHKLIGSIQEIETKTKPRVQ